MSGQTLFCKELLENRVKFSISLLVLSAMAIIIPFLFDFTGNILSKIELPPIIEQGEISFILSSYSNYAWSQWTAKNLTQFATIVAIVLGMGALAGESAYGTAPFLLSKPLSRRKIYAVKAATGIILLATIVFVSTLLLILTSTMKGFELQATALFVSTFSVLLGAAVIYLGTLVFSALIPDPVKAGVAAALFFGLASLPGFFGATARYSIFYQMKGIPYWLKGEIPWFTLFSFLLLGYLFFEAGNYFWRRKDF